jgi:hypothetical protein
MFGKFQRVALGLEAGVTNAQGDLVFFDQFLVDVSEKLHDLENDTIKLALITNAVTPAATTADPRWGAGGTTNLSSNQVTPGGNYASGGATCANPSVTLTGGLARFDADDPAAWAANASNPTNARWGILYNDTDAGKRAIAFLDLGSVFDMTTGPLTVAWNANGLYELNN